MANNNETILPPPPKLAHSYNSRGELGMYVNPYACSCETCVDYVASRTSGPQAEAAAAPPPPPPSPPAPFALPVLSPTPRASETAGADVIAQLYRSAAAFSPPPLARTITGFHYNPPEDDGIAPTESMTVTGHLYPSLGPSSSISPGAGTGAAGGGRPMLAPSATGGMGLGMASSHAGVVRFWNPIPRRHRLTLTAAQMSAFKKMLGDYKQLLEEKQESLDYSGCRSHDEMAALDAEWTEIDEKKMELDEIYGLLLAAEPM